MKKFTPYGDPMIFSGRGNRPLALKICEQLNMTLSEADIYDFENENIFIQLHSSVRGHDVFLIQGLGPPVNRNIMELFIFLETLKRSSAGRITAILPFYAYARSDKKDQPRVPITARLLADLIVTSGADRYMTIDLHAAQIQGFFDIPIDHLMGVPILSDYFETKGLKDIVIVSPDHGGVTRARKMADRLKAPIAIIDKRRPRPNVSEVMNIIGNIEGKTAILIDDIIDTAGTITLAANALVENGASEVYACCTHPVLSGPAIERIQNSNIKELVVTNSIVLPEEKKIDKVHELSVAP